MEDKLYCSVDLEFTGFDPSRDQILEIGFAFFRMTDHGAEITEEWSQVFKPAIEVHPKILGLTGITLEELAAAPDFNEHREFIQSKLRDVIIVAHNPTMDVKFLESYGIKLSGQTIDTLELVQFLLPTHHSYNLENLMHYFGVPHTEAHRALGDCRSTIAVLERLLRIYRSYDQTLQEQIKALVQRGQFAWQPLLEVELSPLPATGHDSLSQQIENLQPLTISGLVTIDPSVANHESRVALGLKDSQNTLLVVEDTATVIRLWRSGLVHGVFSSEDVFSRSAFEKFMQKAVTNEELRFCLKVVVWQHTNWQTEVILDLNISFFGGQYRTFIVGGEQQPKSEPVVCCDYRTLRYVSHLPGLSGREVVVCNLQEFESYISTGGPTRLSWNGVLYSLRTIYNPETEFGNQEAKEPVLSALASTDLFFALVFMLLHRAYPNLPYVALPQLATEQPHIFRRLSRAAETLQIQIGKVLELSPSPQLSQFHSFLGRFFEEQPGRIRWVAIDEQNSVFHDQPLDISASAQEQLAPFKSVRFTDTISQRDLLFYYAERLGLNTEQSDFSQYSGISTNHKLSLQSEVPTDEQLLETIKNSSKPTVVLWPSLPEAKRFYNDHYVELKTVGALFAQGYSGGGNKMFRNFSIKPNSILLATPEFVARQPHVLSPKSIMIIEPPEVDASHPYINALLSHWKDRFPALQQLLVAGKLTAALKKLAGLPDATVTFYGLQGDTDLSKLIRRQN